MALAAGPLAVSLEFLMIYTPGPVMNLGGPAEAMQQETRGLVARRGWRHGYRWRAGGFHARPDPGEPAAD